LSNQLVLIFAFFGLAYGIVLQRSGFCFSRACYELFLLRTREALDGVMAGLVLATAGFSIVFLIRAASGGEGGAHMLAVPLGLSTLLGGALFGTGMALAGMCAVGALQRLGEGYVSALVVLLGILIGAFTDPSRLLRPLLGPALPAGLSLTYWLHPAAAFLLTLAALLLIWCALRATGVRQATDAGGHLSARQRFAMPRLTDSPLVGGILLGVLNTAQMSVAMPWTAGYPLAAIPSLVVNPHTPAALPMLPGLLALNGGVVLGALLSSAAARDLHFRAPRRWEGVPRSLAGGLLMGWGIKLGCGCTLGGFFSAVPSLALGGWVYLLGLLMGAWFGVRLLAKGM
jgi:hypothetical protein